MRNNDFKKEYNFTYLLQVIDLFREVIYLFVRDNSWLTAHTRGARWVSHTKMNRDLWKTAPV